jgi:TPR repeat protein
MSFSLLPAFAFLRQPSKATVTLSMNLVRFNQPLSRGRSRLIRQCICLSGTFHEHGRGGCELNDLEAATWYAKAAEQDHTGAEASLGRLFLVGTQVQQDVAKAVHFLQRAAAKVRRILSISVLELYLTNACTLTGRPKCSNTARGAIHDGKRRQTGLGARDGISPKCESLFQ